MLLKRIVAVFTKSIVSEDDVTQVKQAGKEDGKLLIAAWWEGAQEGMGEAVSELKRELLTYDDIEEGVVVPDTNEDDDDDDDDNEAPRENYDGWARGELMRECKRRGIPYTRKVTAKELRKKLAK
jgi:hypothetical protein